MQNMFAKKAARVAGKLETSSDESTAKSETWQDLTKLPGKTKAPGPDKITFLDRTFASGAVDPAAARGNRGTS